jgi:uncharacterized membrane protein (UPF0182 family)
MIGAIFGGFS